jgi:1,4-alpha-glucan branching enzyme
MLWKTINDLAPKRVTGVQNVHFILVNDQADQVYLVGDFNGWSKTQTPLVKAANNNSWTVSVPLTHGRHEYAFVVKDGAGEHWVADPLLPAVEDEFGTESSIVRVGSASP